MSISATLPQSSDNSAAQATPVSPTSSNGSSNAAPAAPPKRTNRRANTAERRATHNAVERARRETLNGRFLDLAAMLPNLAAVRRPSKSAIVNSSIALIHASRRHRAVAGREMRAMKAEADALRQELNEWRQRANLPRVEEPPRSSDLIALLNVEEEPDMGEDERRAYEMRDRVYEDGEDFAEDGEDGFGEQFYNQQAAPQPPVNVAAQRLSIQGHQAHLAAQQQAVYAQQQVAIARASQMQMAASNAQRPMAQQQVQPVQNNQAQIFDASIFASVDNFPEPKLDMYGQMFGSVQTQPTMHSNWSQNANNGASSLLTPPGSGHGVKTSPFASTANQAFLGNYNQNGNIFNASFMNGSLSGSDDGDSLSVGSAGHDGHYISNSPDHSLGSSPVDHQFAFTAPGAAYGQPSRRLSVNIPAQAIGGPKQASPFQNGGAPFAAMGLMM